MDISVNPVLCAGHHGNNHYLPFSRSSKKRDMNLRKNKPKLYTVIVKVSAEKFVKYHCSDLLSLVSFLDKNYPGWRWFNVYSQKTKTQLANFTNKDRPTSKKIPIK